MSRRVRIASINVNGIRAATRKGMLEWLADAEVDVMALQEVRASADELALALPGWELVNDEALAKGRAGVAIASRTAPTATRTVLGQEGLDSAGRWIEADFEIEGERLTVVSAYVHTGEADTPRQDAKWAFLDAMEVRMPRLRAESPLALIMGDLNVGHRELDIRNWKGNVKKAGFLPRERAYFDRFLGTDGEAVTGVDGSTGTGLGWVDVGRRFHGEVDGPYTWWSMRGRAFDNDTGWRIDYHLATPALADR
ncbi:MAG: endonuclease/exonuclease/phosphatase family protein, partial [Microbacterium sp.]|nr:endonuclease/exonuclease/phosphatase family protein [Microbacterium sp.]